jgi:hypothetical protein
MNFRNSLQSLLMEGANLLAGVDLRQDADSLVS